MTDDVNDDSRRDISRRTPDEEPAEMEVEQSETITRSGTGTVTESTSRLENQQRRPLEVQHRDGRQSSLLLSRDRECTDGIDLSIIEQTYRNITNACRQDYENVLVEQAIPDLANSVALARTLPAEVLDSAEPAATPADDDDERGEEPDYTAGPHIGKPLVEPGDTPLRYFHNYKRRH